MGNKETDVFDFGKFKETLSEFYSLKEAHTPYYYREWTTSSDKADSPTAKCKVILEKLAKQIELLTKSFPGTLDKRPEPHPCRGATYFPRHPWVSILFRNEKQTDGLYPALGLSEYGMIVACGESERRPQPQFDKIRLTGENIADEGDDVLRSLLTEHLSKNFGWFPKNKPLDEATFVESWKKAVEDYMYCRFGYVEEKLRPSQRQAKNREPDEHWFSISKVRTIEEWLYAVSHLNGHWIFRGQANSEWNLESGMERLQALNTDDREADYVNARKYENEILQEFRREVARRPEYSNFSDVDLMTVMQHYGSKTRLLDFSFSPLVALYMAMEQYEKDFAGKEDDAKGKVSMAVWAIDADKITLPELPDSWVERENNDRIKDIFEKYKANPDKLEWWEKCILWHLDAKRVFCSASADLTNGMDVLLPNANNERCSVQEGLFLMKRSLREPFEKNLQTSFSDDAKLAKASVVRHDFSKRRFSDIKRYLKRFCITPKMVYPDLTGLAKSMNAKLDFGREEERWA